MFIFSGIKAQQPLMNSIEEAGKIKDNENQFINKSLKILLKEIGPEIRMVTANPSKNANARLGYFIFRFVDIKTYDSCRLNNKYPLQITVFVNAPFSWHVGKKKISYKSSWTKEDLEKYGDLIVVGIRVFGK